MNKKLLPIAALIISSSAMNAYATNGKVNFTGEIIESTCTVTSGDQSKNVIIGNYPTSAFANKGDVTASKAFTINLEKCKAGDYSLRFDGPSVAGYPNLLSVDQAGGVGIEILTNDEKIIPINQDANVINVATTGDASGTATFNLKARYKSFLDKVTAGTANASATFTIEYK
ncbi:TPA: type 1 fimbrial protein [Escherichia coli]|nr:type 1 fimbrial protein [Escherichia coli]HCJ8169375.1 type 1 fimbrial protein [Escherichia coli]